MCVVRASLISRGSVYNPESVMSVDELLEYDRVRRRRWRSRTTAGSARCERPSACCTHLCLRGGDDIDFPFFLLGNPRLFEHEAEKVKRHSTCSINLSMMEGLTALRYPSAREWREFKNYIDFIQPLIRLWWVGSPNTVLIQKINTGIYCNRVNEFFMESPAESYCLKASI